MSSIQDPEGNPYLEIREWQVKLCEGDHCAAALLSFFKRGYDFQLCQPVVSVTGKQVPDENIFQCYSYQDLNQGLLGVFDMPAILHAIKHLKDLGVISIRQTADAENFYAKWAYWFHPEVCRQWLENNDSSFKAWSRGL